LTGSVSTPDVVVRDYASADYSACRMLWVELTDLQPRDLSWSSAHYPPADDFNTEARQDDIHDSPAPEALEAAWP